MTENVVTADITQIFEVVKQFNMFKIGPPNCKISFIQDRDNYIHTPLVHILINRMTYSGY